MIIVYIGIPLVIFGIIYLGCKIATPEQLENLEVAEKPKKVKKQVKHKKVKNKKDDNGDWVDEYITYDIFDGD